LSSEPLYVMLEDATESLNSVLTETIAGLEETGDEQTAIRSSALYIKRTESKWKFSYWNTSLRAENFRRTDNRILRNNTSKRTYRWILNFFFFYLIFITFNSYLIFVL